jgi:hypothetical protein
VKLGLAIDRNRRKIMQATAWELRNRLLAMLNSARHSGKPYIEVKSGYLDTQVGEVPNLPVCCEVMRQMMRSGDSIVKEPANGEDATLTIRYVV